MLRRHLLLVCVEGAGHSPAPSTHTENDMTLGTVTVYAPRIDGIMKVREDGHRCRLTTRTSTSAAKHVEIPICRRAFVVMRCGRV